MDALSGSSYSMVFPRYKHLVVDVIATAELRASPTRSTSRDSDNMKSIKSIDVRVVCRIDTVR